MPSGEDPYLQMLRAQMALFDELAKVRCEKNDIHDAKMTAWDNRRHEYMTNAQFQEMWSATPSHERTLVLSQREREILVLLDKTQATLDHLKFAGLSDVAA